MHNVSLETHLSGPQVRTRICTPAISILSRSSVTVWLQTRRVEASIYLEMVYLLNSGTWQHIKNTGAKKTKSYIDEGNQGSRNYTQEMRKQEQWSEINIKIRVSEQNRAQHLYCPS